MRKPVASLEQQKQTNRKKSLEDKSRVHTARLPLDPTERIASTVNPFGTFSEVRKNPKQNTRTSVAVPAGKHHDKQASQRST